MGKVLELKPRSKLPSVVRKTSNSIFYANQPREKAVRLMLQAATLLGEIDGPERRICWVLEDCARIVGDNGSAELSQPA